MEQTEMATNSMPRIAEEAPIDADILALTMDIISTDWKHYEAEAGAPLSGQDELHRFALACQNHNHRNSKKLFVGRAEHDEIDFHKLDLGGLRKYCGLTRTSGVFTTTDCTNTANQIKWVMEQAMKHRVKSLAIYSAGYHILRCFGTAIKAMETLGMPWIPILPIATGRLYDPVPELVRKGQYVIGRNMVPNEIKRFIVYSSDDRVDAHGKSIPPDVANVHEIAKYLDWIRTEHPHLYQ